LSKHKSPLTASPLRNAGQSLDRALDDHFDTHLLMPIMAIAFSLVLVGLEWWSLKKGARHAFCKVRGQVAVSSKKSLKLPVNIRVW
jgi:hypothetical protein